MVSGPTFADSPSALTHPHSASRDWRARLPFFYGWLILAGSVVALALAYSVMYSFSVFYAALLQEFPWSRGAAAGVYSVFTIVSGVGALTAGTLSDRFGPGSVISIGGALLASGLVACSRVTELWQFYLAFGVLAGLGVSMAGWTACVILVSRWFSARLGVALGIASGGIGIGITVVAPLVQFLITTFGWRVAYLALACTVFLGLLPLGLIVLRGRPEDLGQLADGGCRAGAAPPTGAMTSARLPLEVVDEKWVTTEWTLGMAVRTRRCWLLAAMKVCGGIAAQMVFVHQVVYFVDWGYDRMLAASIVGLIGFFSVPSKIYWGWSADTIGRERTYTLGCAAMVLAVGLLALATAMPFPGVLYLYALIFAMGYAVSAPLFPIVASDLFAGRRFGSIYGFVSIFTGLGNALGAWLGGHVYDVTGSYLIAFAVAAFGTTVSAGALWLAAPRKVRRVAKRSLLDRGP